MRKACIASVTGKMGGVMRLSCAGPLGRDVSTMCSCVDMSMQEVMGVHALNKLQSLSMGGA